MNNLKTIGILYKHDPNWMGGTIYVFNLLKALEFAQTKNIELPEIVVFISRNNKNKLDFSFSALKYSFRYYDSPKWMKLINRISVKIIRISMFQWRYQHKLDALFPVNRSWDYFSNTPIENQIYWIPDFQCFHLPEYFEEQDIQNRNFFYLETLINSKKLVLSSYNVLNDLTKFYPNMAYPVIEILRFAVFNNIDSIKIEKKLVFDKPYFICPNQFWAHKNQELVLRAIQYLGEVNLPFYVVFTGKTIDSRKKNHFKEVIEPLLDDKNVRNNVKLLGFIDRDVQLDLIQNAIALIQPSRFEGWSTVIEDGMSYNLPILASNLEVNIEQLGDKGIFFDPNNVELLSSLMLDEFKYFPRKIKYNYEHRQINFAREFLNIIK
jgi:glycosyltransferase involved in cell wall biosynthesis